MTGISDVKKDDNEIRFLSKNSMKRLLRFVIIANKKLNKKNNKIKSIPNSSHHLNIDKEITRIKEKLRKRVNINKPLKIKKQKEFFEKKKKEKEEHIIIKEKPKIITPNPFAELKKQKILEIKDVLSKLGEKHKTLIQSDEDYDPVIIGNIEEKINLLKNRISIIENE